MAGISFRPVSLAAGSGFGFEDIPLAGWPHRHYSYVFSSMHAYIQPDISRIDVFIIGGAAGVVPTQQQLLDNHVHRFTEQGLRAQQHEISEVASSERRSASMSADQYLQQLSSPSLIPSGEGLPALSHRIVEKIKAGEYVDFSELPPAKGKGRTSSNDWDARVLLLQVQQTDNPRRLIPDFPTWAQCFALFTAVKASFQPAITSELMAYMSEMGKYAKRFQWPSWVIYDQNFRQEMASRPGLMWTRAEPTIFAQCFLGMAKQSAEAWCKYCHSVDHASDLCGEAPRRAPRVQPYPQGSTQICRNYNSQKGCFFHLCKYSHRCIICKGTHPKPQCPSLRGRKENTKPPSE